VDDPDLGLADHQREAPVKPHRGQRVAGLELEY
jgi:hypothetical protein